MLAINVDRRPVSRASVALTVLALLAVSLPAAGFSAAQTTGIVAGSIVDPSNAALPGVKVVLTGTRNGRTHEARTNAAGRYELAGVAPGEYELTASLPGFATATQSISLSAGQAVSRDLAMEIGTLQETITVSGRNQTETYSTAVSGRSVEEMRAERAAACTPAPAAAPAADGTLRVGGNLRAPRKLRDVRPIYPDHLRTAGTGGTVMLEARIGTGGNVAEVNVVSTPHADLGASAAEAVRQWQFDATLLNCVPVEVSMKVTVTFDPER